MASCVRMQNQQRNASMSMPASFVMTSENKTDSAFVTGVAAAMPVFVCLAVILLALELSLFLPLLGAAAMILAVLIPAGLTAESHKGV